MSSPADPPRYIVVRTSRETLGLVACAGAMTLALSVAIHAKHERVATSAAPPPQEAQAPQQDWAGHLADVAPVATSSTERLTSAALVVPKTALALPQPPTKPKRQCGDAACLAGKTPAAAPKRQQVATTEPQATQLDPPNKSLLHQLNPLNHLPDMAVVGRPFTYAGGTVAGWFKRL